MDHKLPPVLIVEDDDDVRHAAQVALEPHVERSDAVSSTPSAGSRGRTPRWRSS
jgi:hypothetical protein